MAWPVLLALAVRRVVTSAWAEIPLSRDIGPGHPIGEVDYPVALSFDCSISPAASDNPHEPAAHGDSDSIHRVLFTCCCSCCHSRVCHLHSHRHCPTYSPNKDPPSHSESHAIPSRVGTVRLNLRRDKVHGQQMTRMHIGVIRDWAALPAPL